MARYQDARVARSSSRAAVSVRNPSLSMPFSGKFQSLDEIRDLRSDLSPAGVARAKAPVGGKSGCIAACTTAAPLLGGGQGPRSGARKTTGGRARCGGGLAPVPLIQVSSGAFTKPTTRPRSSGRALLLVDNRPRAYAVDRRPAQAALPPSRRPRAVAAAVRPPPTRQDQPRNGPWNSMAEPRTARCRRKPPPLLAPRHPRG